MSSAHCKSRIIGREKICPFLLEICFVVKFSKPAISPVTKTHLSSGHLKGESCCFLSRLVIRKMKGALSVFLILSKCILKLCLCFPEGTNKLRSARWDM